MTKGVRAMTLTNADRGGLVGAFIVEDGDEVLSITQGGQVVRSPINADFRPTGRSTQGVKFVTPKSGDAVAVVARSVEAKVVGEVPDEPADGPAVGGQEEGVAPAEVSDNVLGDDTIASDSVPETAPEPEDEG